MKQPKYEVSLQQRLNQRKDPYGDNSWYRDRGRRKCYVIRKPGHHRSIVDFLTHTEMVQKKLQGCDLKLLSDFY